MAMDIGAFTPMLHGIRERETINDLIEALCGARLTYNYHRIGGVAFDMPEGWRDKVLAFLDHFDRFLVEYDRLISFNEIYIKRLAERGRHPRPDGDRTTASSARTCAAPASTGTSAATCPTAPTRTSSSTCRSARASAATSGDCFDRYYVRCLEMARVLEDRPPGARDACPRARSRPRCRATSSPRPARRSRRVESARGEMAYYVVSDGTNKAYRVRARTGSFTAMCIIEDISRGLMVADLVALISSLDVVAPEIDR